MQKLALVVDDSRVARMTLSKLLAAHGLAIFEVGSAEEALSYLQSDEPRPDIIFMDVMMDGIDGLAATQQLKADNNLSDIPVVICTGNDTQTDKDKALAVGANEVLTKPPVALELATILNKLQAVKVIEEKPRIVEPAFDETALITRIITKVEQKVLPLAQQSARETAEDISRQIAEETAENIAKQYAQVMVESLTPDLTRQVSDQAKKIVEETANRECKSAAHDAVVKMAEYAVQDTMEKMDIANLISTSLASEGQLWLDQQQQQLHQKIKAESTAYLQEQLPLMATPLVHKVMEEKLAEVELEVEQQDEKTVEPIPENIDKVMKGLAKRITLLNYMVVVLGVVALIGIGVF